MKLFTHFEQLLSSAESITFTMEKQPDNLMRVSLSPNLVAAPDNLPDAQAKLRAALTYPLVVKGSANDLDERFSAMLQDYANSRTAIQGSLSVLSTLKKVAASGSQQAAQAKRKTDKPDQAAGKANHADPSLPPDPGESSILNASDDTVL